MKFTADHMNSLKTFTTKKVYNARKPLLRRLTRNTTIKANCGGCNANCGSYKPPLNINRYRNHRKTLFRRIFQCLVLTAAKCLRCLKLRQQKSFNGGFKITKNNNFLLKNNTYLLKNYTLNIKCTNFNNKNKKYWLWVDQNSKWQVRDEP
jgi:hypothetical protein